MYVDDPNSLGSGEVFVADQQDALRTVRQFVSIIGDAFGGYDQTYAGQDGYVLNTPRQYQTVGPYGTSVEGTAISTTRGGGIVISPTMVMIGLGFALAMLWKR